MGRIAAGIPLTLLLVSPAFAAAAATGPTAERPAYREGQHWILDNGAYALVRADQDTYVFSAGPGEEIHLSRNLVPVKIVRHGRVEWDLYPPPPVTWPLAVGKWGSLASTVRSPDHRSGLDVDVTWEVKAYEPVESVPGAPRAFRIVYTVRAQELSRQRARPLSGRTSWSLATWYAPETGQIVKMSEPNVEALNLQVRAPDVPSAPAKTPMAPTAPPVAPPAAQAPPPAAFPPGQAAPPVTAAAPTTTPPSVPDRWAVIIGIGHYDRPGIPSLQYTVADAEALRDAVVQEAGFKEDHVLLLTDRTERKPTLRNVKWAIGTFLARSARKDDVVLIFFAGHGAPEIDPRGVETDGFAKYLVPSDADPDDLYSTGFPMDEFQTVFDRIEAERVIVLIDACYSGAAGGRTFASRRTRAARVDDRFLDRLSRAKGRAIITAARASEVALELPDLGHGLFTHYLLRGLSGSADLDHDGIVTLPELYQYLEQQVSVESRRLGGNQHPVLRGDLAGVLPLVEVGRAPTSR